MRRIEYKLTLDGEPFSVASCNMERPFDEEGNHPLPIEMNVLRCKTTSDSSDIANIIRAAVLNEHGVPVDFAERYGEILLGKSQEWILAQFQVSAGRVKLQYYRPATGDIEDISLVVDGDPINLLSLEFKVPHRDGRLDTEYRVDTSYSRMHRSEPFSNEAYITERLPLAHRRTLFLLDSRKPGEMSVVENVDL